MEPTEHFGIYFGHIQRLFRDGLVPLAVCFRGRKVIHFLGVEITPFCNSNKKVNFPRTPTVPATLAAYPATYCSGNTHVPVPVDQLSSDVCTQLQISSSLSHAVTDQLPSGVRSYRSASHGGTQLQISSPLVYAVTDQRSSETRRRVTRSPAATHWDGAPPAGDGHQSTGTRSDTPHRLFNNGWCRIDSRGGHQLACSTCSCSGHSAPRDPRPQRPQGGPPLSGGLARNPL